MSTLNTIILFVTAFALGFYAHSFTIKGEEITEQQYREQSLQYLEDIRNSLDASPYDVNRDGSINLQDLSVLAYYANNQ